MNMRLCVALVFLVSASIRLGAAPSAPVVPRLTHPGAGQTFYFVLADRFANGSTANDRGYYPGGPDDHGFDPTRISHYHGGDFAGLTARLDYLQGLGVTAIWVTPPVVNKPVQQGTAGYHGYWPVDLLNIDPHLGTNDEFRAFVDQAHARGMKFFMDIITNHTADVIQLQGDHRYIGKDEAPYRDAEGRVFDERAVAFNGINDPARFPALSAERSFPYRPVVPAAEANAKNPAWLNDVTLYHNRGNTTFTGENAVHGDFVGLDDVFTEHPRVVEGFIEIFSHWIEAYGVDGFRIDTARHVNAEFWQAFIPAIQARAAAAGRGDFLQFGEVYNEAGDPAVLSEFSTGTIPIDTSIDFGFFAAARRFVSQRGTAAAFADFIARDDYYTDHDGNVHATPTFLGNHDAGRFGYFLQQDNPGASPAQLLDLASLGHGLLLLSRGQPVLYYGDEQGMIGRGGHDMQARESLFASQAPDFATAPLLGTSRIGVDDKYDTAHPLYRLIQQLTALRARHVALRTGAMLPRVAAHPSLLGFSRIDRDERVEYLVVANSARIATATALVPTSQPAGATMRLLFDSRRPGTMSGEVARVGADGSIAIALEPLHFAVWQATAPVPAGPATPRIELVSPAAGATLAFTTRTVDGLDFSSRHEIRAEVMDTDGVAEVTFLMERSSRPGQYDYLGTDDAAPYRIFWRPPVDLAPGETFAIVATVDNLRGRRATTHAEGLTVAMGDAVFGIRGAQTPVLSAQPGDVVTVERGGRATLTVTAAGTAPLTFQWFRDGAPIAGGTGSTLTLSDASEADAGTYTVLVRNRAGSSLSKGTLVTVAIPTATTAGRIVRLGRVSSVHVAARPVDVWLPPGYDVNADMRYPVIYMHDGQNVFSTGKGFDGQTWSVDLAMARLVQAGETRGAIIVGVWNTAARTAEYLPQKAFATDRLADVEGLVHRTDDPIQSDAYLRFLVEELKPHIDRAYRTRADRAHTFIMGSSMGGLISAYAVAEYPEVFGGAACLSTHWPAGDGAIIDHLKSRLPAAGAHRLYFDFGTETLDASYGGYQQLMDRALAAAGYAPGVDWVSRRFVGADHTERAWRERVDIPLRFLLRGTGGGSVIDRTRTDRSG